MKDKIHLIIEIAGALAAIFGVGILFIEEKYLLGLLLTILAIAIIIYIIISSRIEPLKHRYIEWNLKIFDKQGHKTILKKTKIIKVNRENITTIDDRYFSASGKYTSFKTNIGELLQPIDEGGTKTLYTIFKFPLEKGKVIEHILECHIEDTYIEKKESFAAWVIFKTEKIKINVEFPTDRSPRNIKVFRLNIGEPIPVNEFTVTNNGLKISLEVDKPPKGARYLIEWEW
jgi:hypothetical protein